MEDQDREFYTNLLANLGQAGSTIFGSRNSAGNYYLGNVNKPNPNDAAFYQGLKEDAKNVTEQNRLEKAQALKDKLTAFELLKNKREEGEWAKADAKTAALKDPSSPESMALDSGYRSKLFALASSLKDTDPQQAAKYYRDAMSPLKMSGEEVSTAEASFKPMADLAPDLYKQKQKGLIDLAQKRQELAMKPKDPAEFLSIENKKQITDLAADTAKKRAIKNTIDAALVILNDPNVSEDQKITAGNGLIKTLNSTEGADAVSVDEAKRLAAFLENKMFNFRGPGSFFGRDLDQFNEQVALTSQKLAGAIQSNNRDIKALYGKQQPEQEQSKERVDASIPSVGIPEAKASSSKSFVIPGVEKISREEKIKFLQGK